MNADRRWNLLQQAGVEDRRAGIGGLQDVNFEAALRQILGQTQRPLHADTTHRRKQVGDQQKFSVGQTAPKVFYFQSVSCAILLPDVRAAGVPHAKMRICL